MILHILNFASDIVIIMAVIGLITALLSKNKAKNVEFYVMRMVLFAGVGAVLGILLGFIIYNSF